MAVKDELKEYRLRLSEDMMYQNILKDAIKSRPLIPGYNSKEDNTEEWKSKSMMQLGFDLCYQAITGKKLEIKND